MKRNYQSEAQKRQAKRRKIAEAARNSQRLSSWLTRPETSKADEQEVSIPETESTPQFVDVNSFNNSTNEENFDTTVRFAPIQLFQFLRSFPCAREVKNFFVSPLPFSRLFIESRL